jgi:FtsH-binding integral membrane protein
MESPWAAEHLEVIRTLMERAAIYRRALAPTTLLTGALGVVASIAGWIAGIESPRAFGIYWMLIGLGAVAAAFLLMRRQALQDREPFWSPPTRRVVQALSPPLLAGGGVGFLLILPEWREPLHAWWLPGIWMIFYGCALHAAGFFTPRGIRLLGWIFLVLGGAFLGVVNARSDAAGLPALSQAHWVMGAAFGGLHLAYGSYLRFTERRPKAA